MHFERLETGKKQYLELLLLADEQESMVDRYLERGEMFLLKNDASEVVAEAVVTKEADGVFEIKNLAVKPQYQRQGYGRQIITFLLNRYRGQAQTMMVGTGESAKTMAFYQVCGFSFSHRIKDFFLENLHTHHDLVALSAYNLSHYIPDKHLNMPQQHNRPILPDIYIQHNNNHHLPNLLD